MVSQFSDRSLPKASWNHQAHLIVGIWHVKELDFKTAYTQVKSKIKAYNLAVGTPNTDDTGYHETLTIFWLLVTKTFAAQHDALPLTEVCHLFLQSSYAAKTYPLEYYSKAVLFSTPARKSWIDGNLKTTSYFVQFLN